MGLLRERRTWRVQVQAELEVQEATAAIHRLAEGRLLGVHLLGHPHVGLSHSWKQEGHRPLSLGLMAAPDLGGSGALQHADGLLPLPAHHHLPVVKSAAPHLQGVGHIRQVEFGMRLQMRRQIG